MPDTAPVPLDVIQDNLKTQVDASQQMLDIIGELAKRAGNKHDNSISPAIGPELEKLVNISRDLRQSANGVAQAVVTTLESGSQASEAGSAS